MSRKDYEMIAKVISETFNYDDLRSSNHSPSIIPLMIREIEYFKAELCRRLAIKFGDANGRFNKDMFYDACGIKTAN